MVLEQYAATFAYWGSISMLPLFVCPLIVCWNIIKFGFSDFFPPSTFLDGLLRSVLFYYHGKLLMSNDIMQQNLFGIILQLIYLALYYYYLYYKAPFHKAALKSGAVIVALILYASYESPVLAPERFGYILTVLNLSTSIYPIRGIQYTITAKTTFGLPYTIIFFGQVVTTLWLLFAISVRNYVFMWQMLIPFVLGAVQISLYFIYPNTPVFANVQTAASTATATATNEPKNGVTTTTASAESESSSAKASEKLVMKDRKSRLAELKMKKIPAPKRSEQKKYV